VGLQKKQYCIFNVQYSKEEYFALREKIIKQMAEMPYRNAKGITYSYGEFFPEEFSPFVYNETQLIDIYPLTKEEAIAKGYSWREPELKEYQTTILASNLPDVILQTPETILKELIQCETCKRAYRITQSEFDFLKKMGIPLPRSCFNCRLAVRFVKLNKPLYYHRQCICMNGGRVYKNANAHSHGEKPCPNEFETSYAPDCPEIIYCEQCYQAEVV